MKKTLSFRFKAFLIILTISNVWACKASPSLTPTLTQTNTVGSLSTDTLIPIFLLPTSTYHFASKTLTPTLTITRTSTAVPPLVSHEWVAEEILISFYNYGGDGVCGPRIWIPKFTLLSTGELFIDDYIESLNSFKLQSTTLSGNEICKLLNSIDQAGFWDYDPSTYPENYEDFTQFMGAQSTNISINAWRSNSVRLYGLSDFIREMNNCPNCSLEGYPTILTSLRKTYQLLEDFRPSTLKIYQSERLGIWIQAGLSGENAAMKWPLKSIRLSELITEQNRTYWRPDIIFTGENARNLFHLFIEGSGFCGVDVEEDEKTYFLEFRWLLPHEFQADTPAPKALSCSPNDGWIEIP
jgi:hypothetical protein